MEEIESGARVQNVGCREPRTSQLPYAVAHLFEVRDVMGVSADDDAAAALLGQAQVPVT